MLHVTPCSMEVWSSYVCTVFGTLGDIMSNKLPSYENIFKWLLIDKKKLMNGSRVQCSYDNVSYASVGKEPCFKLIFDHHSNSMKLFRKNNKNYSQEYLHKIKKIKEHANLFFYFFLHVIVFHLKIVLPLKLKRLPYLNKFFWLTEETLEKCWNVA